MPRKRALNKDQEMELFRMVQKGFSNQDISKKFGISINTVGQYYRRTLRERARQAEERNGKPRIVAAREVGTSLTFDVDNGYVGHTKLGEVEETCAFKAIDDVDATTQFDKWCDEMRAEADFMSMCERKKPAFNMPSNVQAPDTDDLAEQCNADVETIMLEKMEMQERIEELESQLAERNARIAELQKPVVGVAPKDSVSALPEVSYALIAVKPKLKGYGLFTDMDNAFAELERLNNVAQMLGMDDAFEVHEIAWKE